MTYFIDPFGCVKNQIDGENMMAFLNRAGWKNVENAEDAELIIVNSCGFIESAKQESVNAVLGWKKFYPEKKILLAGCLAQRYPRELAETLPEADGLFGVEDLSGIDRAARETLALKEKDPPEKKPAPRPGKRPLLSLPGSAYVKISEGCDNRCSYCAIPLIRGSLRSRKVTEVIGECKALIDRGIRELCLVAQDVCSYGRDLNNGHSLPGLLEEISRLKGSFRVRLLYMHPDNFPLNILDIVEQESRFLPYFDIPFQHSSEKILRLMNRRGCAGKYLDLIETIRARLPDAVIRSTFLLGFPCETGEDFELLLDFQEKAHLDWLGCFAYSREEDTPAWGMKGRVSKKTAAERKQLIEERQVPITEKQMDRFTGRAFDVLVEEKFDTTGTDFDDGGPAGNSLSEGGASRDTHLYLGRLPFQAPDVDGAAVIHSTRPLDSGSLIPCRITGRTGFDLQVRPVD